MKVSVQQNADLLPLCPEGEFQPFLLMKIPLMCQMNFKNYDKLRAALGRDQGATIRSYILSLTHGVELLENQRWKTPKPPWADEELQDNEWTGLHRKFNAAGWGSGWDGGEDRNAAVHRAEWPFSQAVRSDPLLLLIIQGDTLSKKLLFVTYFITYFGMIQSCHWH